MKKWIAVMMLALAGGYAWAQSPVELLDNNFVFVGHPKWGVDGPSSQYGQYEIWMRGCVNIQCFPVTGSTRGLYEAVTDGSELWHPQTVYFQGSNCDTTQNFYFTIGSNTDPNHNLNAKARTAVTGNREFGVTTGSPASPPTYVSFKNPYGPCVSQVGTAPAPASQYRLNGIATGKVWTPPMFFE